MSNDVSPPNFANVRRAWLRRAGRTLLVLVLAVIPWIAWSNPLSPMLFVGFVAVWLILGISFDSWLIIGSVLCGVVFSILRPAIGSGWSLWDVRFGLVWWMAIGGIVGLWIDSIKKNRRVATNNPSEKPVTHSDAVVASQRIAEHQPGSDDLSGSR